MKVFLFAVSLLLLSACGVPTAVVVLSAADGVTYLSSGKSIGSHTLTVATDRDCSILFGITRGKFCKEKEQSDDFAKKDAGLVVPKDKPAVRSRMTPPSDEGKSSRERAVTEPRFFDFEYEIPPAPAVADSGPAENHPRWALVLGSFRDYRSAVELARQMKPQPGLITMATIQGDIHFRVSTGPLNQDQDVNRQVNIAALDLKTVKLMPVCPVGTQNESCIAIDQTGEAQQAELPSEGITSTEQRPSLIRPRTE